MTTSLFRSRRRFLVQATTQASAIGFVGGFALAGEKASVVDRHVANPRQLPTSGFEQVLSFSVSGKHASALAIGPNDQIYVAVDRQIKVFDRDGVYQRAVDFAKVPRGLDVDLDGTMYVAMARTIEVVMAGGHRAAWLPPVSDVWFNDLVLNGSEVCVADASTRVVWRLDRAGSVLGRFEIPTATDSGASDFYALTALDGQLHVADPRRHQISSFDAVGQCQRKWGIASRDLAGFSGCCNPVSLAVRYDGQIVTAERGIPRVKLFSNRGEFVAMIAGPEAFSIEPSSAAKMDSDCSSRELIVGVDSANRTLVLDPLRRQVQIFA